MDDYTFWDWLRDLVIVGGLLFLFFFFAMAGLFLRFIRFFRIPRRPKQRKAYYPGDVF